MERIFYRGWKEIEKQNNREINDFRDWIREEKKEKIRRLGGK